MQNNFPSPHVILDVWRVYRCNVATRAYSGLCKHSSEMEIERARELEIKEHERCLGDGQKVIGDSSWMTLFGAVMNVTSTYPYSDEPSKNVSGKTLAEENALAAVGYYWRTLHQKI